MPNELKTIRVFYAWQSDLPEQFNRHAIRQAISRAAVVLTEEASGSGKTLTVVVDDATRGMVGSGHIPSSILQKIVAADFFVGDVSSINSNQQSERKTPNPNVVFELGFAAASLGWQRILMLINTSLGGSPEDMPFDFDRHRASSYTLANGAGTQHALNALVLKALRDMVQADAPRPTASVFNEAEAQRSRDLTNIRWLLQAIHLPTLDKHLSSSARRLSAASAHFAEVLVDIVASSQFHLYDEELRLAVRLFVEKWAESTDPDEYFSDHPNPNYFLYIATYGEKRLAELESARDHLRTAKSQLFDIIRTRYPEVDLQVTSQDALVRYERHLAAIAEPI